MPGKPASENIVCLCLLNILANFSNLFLQKWLLKSQADDKADDNYCDWQFKQIKGYCSTDPDQTASEGAVWSGSTLLAIPLIILRNDCMTSKI